MTLDERIALSGRRSTGFDYLRIGLSVAIIAFHSCLTCYGMEAEMGIWRGAFRPLVFVLVPGFFALSGFLVAGSLERAGGLPVFLTLRTLRIFPALCVEVFISALLIGPAVSQLPVREYFSSDKTHAYFLNIFGDIHFYLPGVFAQNPFGAVNLQLWTIPYELECYLLLTFLGLSGIVRKPVWFGLAAIAITLVQLYRDMQEAMFTGMPPTGALLVCTFAWGAFLFVCRRTVPYSAPLFWACVAAAWGAIMCPAPGVMYASCLPIAYITVFLGLQNPAKTFIIRAGDYSYGMYLYGFPLLQTVVYLLPGHRVWYICLPVALALAAACAWASWTFLESGILARKNKAAARVDGVWGALRRRICRKRDLPV